MSRVGAFFDVDRTIVSCNTGRLFLRDLRAPGRDLAVPDAAGPGLDGEVPPVADRPAVGRGAHRRPDGGQARARVRRPLPAAGSRRTCCRWWCPARARRSRSTAPRGTCWRSCRRRPRYVTEPLAEVLGIEEVISTRFEVEERAVHRPPASAPPASAGARSTGPRTWWRAASSTWPELVLHGLVHRHADAGARRQPGRGEPRPAPAPASPSGAAGRCRTGGRSAAAAAEVSA